jgi:hypothetical protein
MRIGDVKQPLRSHLDDGQGEAFVGEAFVAAMAAEVVRRLGRRRAA